MRRIKWWERKRNSGVWFVHFEINSGGRQYSPYHQYRFTSKQYFPKHPSRFTLILGGKAIFSKPPNSFHFHIFPFQKVVGISFLKKKRFLKHWRKKNELSTEKIQSFIETLVWHFQESFWCSPEQKFLHQFCLTCGFCHISAETFSNKGKKTWESKFSEVKDGFVKRTW